MHPSWPNNCLVNKGHCLAKKTLFSCWIWQWLNISIITDTHAIAVQKYFVFCQPHPVQLQHRTQDLVCQGLKKVLNIWSIGARRISCWATNFSFLLALWASCLPTWSFIKNSELRLAQGKQNLRATLYLSKGKLEFNFFSPVCLVFIVINQKETSDILHTKGIIEWHKEMSLFSNNFMYRTMFVSEW